MQKNSKPTARLPIQGNHAGNAALGVPHTYCYTAGERNSPLQSVSAAVFVNLRAASCRPYGTAVIFCAMCNKFNQEFLPYSIWLFLTFYGIIYLSRKGLASVCPAPQS